MTDPLGLAAVGALALNEGVKFLYGQAGELLKRWRDRRENAEEGPLPATGWPPGVFTGGLRPVQPDLGVLGDLAGPLRELRTELAEYAQGVDPIDPADEALLGRIDALRRAIEAAFGQRVTFVGESAEPSGAPVSGSVRVEEVLGYVAGLRAQRVSGAAAGSVEAGRVGPGGTAVGLDAGEIG